MGERAFDNIQHYKVLVYFFYSFVIRAYPEEDQRQ